MKFSQALAGAAILAPVLAYPGMGAKFAAIGEQIAKRNDPVGVNIPLGDLKGGPRTTTGHTITDCFADNIDCYLTDPKTYTAPPLLSVQCLLDQCCIWDHIQQDLVAYFLNTDGTCNQHARAAIRLSFHDAGPWYEGAPYGGADGSIVNNPQEMTRAENNGLQDIVAYTKQLKLKYPLVSTADLIQFMGAIGVVTCPLGVRMRFFTGRPDSFIPNLPNLMPGINDPADKLVDLFMNKTITAEHLVALVGAHTSSNQFFAIPAQSGNALDPTPGVWDVTFYNFTGNASASAPGVTKFPSDIALSQAPATKPTWDSFTDSHLGRDTWDNSFARAYLRLSLLGVYGIQEMTDCTKVIPTQIMDFKGSTGFDNNVGPQPA